MTSEQAVEVIELLNAYQETAQAMVLTLVILIGVIIGCALIQIMAVLLK